MVKLFNTFSIYGFRFCPRAVVHIVRNFLRILLDILSLLTRHRRENATH